MDSHYDQVMKAREQADANAPRRYFAYSTILDRAAFDEWKHQHSYGFFELPEGRLAEALDVDLVYDFPSRWWGGRVAGLTDAPGARVYGRLFEIPGKDWPIVQHKEGFVTSMCVERTVRVRVDGQEVEATAFVTNPRRASSDGPVSPRFVEALVRGAKSAGLPADYVEKLARGESR
ncbi:MULTISPECIES: gamma-glutamylcyclotransferase [Corallococcus]|uniref:gamma-glutamylcyclotransferase n=1 Tax=Corallococcus TaxID=83461 RepID=UPI000EA3DD32|nr:MULTISPECIES: gamma-glutamylcyclotransferase [unclassified Corallococcus]MBN9685504.1 gamma-glutamylcyclotransferase [Corallococcus sp. NCSPR001]MBZ4329535.1 gamma-glutamylcyclotransferase [Corallococcus sp. AS-1-12]MBZ4374071.1 gamma-glutamylcyclotransferase [Corallococcus sp. AS-1-6]RKG64393.1 gamma-glutamylcyclotransferase [Corallococcus sp. CA054B]WAS83048.1 gamma-glutamylcyclotransferase [Corallococcus sp. NCRR]